MRRTQKGVCVKKFLFACINVWWWWWLVRESKLCMSGFLGDEWFLLSISGTLFFLFFFFTEKIECNSVEIGEKVGVFSLSLHSLFSFLFSLILCVCVWKEDGSYWGDDRTRWYIHGFFLLLFFVKKDLIFMLNLYWVLYEINSSWILWLWDGVFFFFFFLQAIRLWSLKWILINSSTFTLQGAFFSLFEFFFLFFFFLSFGVWELFFFLCQSRGYI